MLKVAHVLLGRCNPESANGVDKAVYHVTKNQALLGLEVEVLNITRKEPIPIPDVKVASLRPSTTFWGTALKARSHIIRSSSDIVHLHSLFVPELTLLGHLLQRSGIPYVITPHGATMPMAMNKNKIKKSAYCGLFERRNLNGTLFVQALCRPEGISLRNLDMGRQIEIVPNGYDFDHESGPVDVNYWARRLPDTIGKRVFLFLGRLDIYYKGLDMLLEAIHSVRDEMKDAVVVLAGPDTQGGYDFLRRGVESLNLGEIVWLSGPIYGSEKSQAVNSCSVFLQPSRSEAVSIGLLEAMGLCRPVLVTHETNMGGVVENCNAGVVSEATVESISLGLRRILHLNDGELEKMGRNARNIVQRDFDWQSIAQKLANCYRGIYV